MIYLIVEGEMLDPTEIDAISINGRVAFGISCLELLCSHWDVKSGQMHSLIEYLWTFTSSNQLDIWEEQIQNILPEVEGGFELYAFNFDFDDLEDERQRVLTNVIDTVIEIGVANLYGGFVSKITREPTLKVARIVQEQGISLPSLKHFKKSHVSEYHGWGRRVPASFFQVNHCE